MKIQSVEEMWREFDREQADVHAPPVFRAMFRLAFASGVLAILRNGEEMARSGIHPDVAMQSTAAGQWVVEIERIRDEARAALKDSWKATS